jgi:sporulation protein YlmC with PRC-barrel domain
MAPRFPVLSTTLASALLVAPMLALGQATSTMPPAATPPIATAPSSIMPPGQATAPAVAVARPMLPTSAAAHLRTSRIVGSTVYDEAGTSIGTVDDLILATGQMDVTAVLAVGTFLGMGGHLVVVPLNDLRFNQQTTRWSLPGATRETLQARTVFTYEQRG